MIAVVLAGASVAAAAVVVRGMRANDPGRRVEGALAAVTAVALASALVSVGATATLLFPSAGLFAWLAAVAALGVAWLRRPVAALPPRPPRSRRRGTRFVVVVAALAAAATAYVAVERLARLPDGEWDAIAFWDLRARLLHRAHGDLSTVFSSEMTPASHPDYPLFVPGLVAYAGMWVGDGSTLSSAAVALLFGALAAAGLFTAVLPRRGRVPACVALLALFAAPHLARQVSWRYADVPLAACLALACGWLACAEERPEGARGALALAGLCASLGAWTKNEGAEHVLALALAVVLVPPAGLSRRGALARFALGAAPFVALLVAFKATLAPANDLVAASTPGGALARVVDLRRYVEIGAAFLGESVRTSHWNLVLPAALVVAALGRTRTGATRAVSVAWGLVLAGYAAVYVLTPKDLSIHLRTSLERLVLHLAPSLLLLAALRAAPGAERRLEAGAAP